MKNYMAMGAIGIAMGAGLGVAFHNIPIGVGVGLTLGVVFGLVRNRRNQNSK